jgi:hypothetical protein
MKPASRLRGVCIALAATLALASPAMAQAYDGDWSGSLAAGAQTLRLVLHVTKGADGLTAVLDSVDQDSTIPGTAVKTDGGELSILFLAVGGELTAKLSPDGQTLAGTWKQGATLPLTLTKRAATGK